MCACVRVVNSVLKGNTAMARGMARAATIMGLRQIHDNNWEGRSSEYPRSCNRVQTGTSKKVMYPRDSDVSTVLDTDTMLKSKNGPVLWLSDFFGCTCLPNEKRCELDLFSGKSALPRDTDASVLVHSQIPYTCNHDTTPNQVTNGTVRWLNFGKGKGAQLFDVRVALGAWPGAHKGMTLYAVTPRFEKPIPKNTQFVMMPDLNMLLVDCIDSLSSSVSKKTRPSVYSWTSLLSCPELWSGVSVRRVDQDDVHGSKELAIMQNDTDALDDHRKYLAAETLIAWMAWRPTWTTAQFEHYVSQNHTRHFGRTSATVRVVSSLVARANDEVDDVLAISETDSLMSKFDDTVCVRRKDATSFQFRL